jgi:hypothetical protein
MGLVAKFVFYCKYCPLHFCSFFVPSGSNKTKVRGSLIINQPINPPSRSNNTIFLISGPPASLFFSTFDVRRPKRGLLCLYSRGCAFHIQPLGVNFINILLEHFFYLSVLCSFSLVTVLLCDFLAKGFRHKRLM